YDQSLLPNETILPETFLERCGTNPAPLFFWLKNEDAFSNIMFTKWTGGSKNTSKTRRNQR
ncbi:MAG: hypothetical protein ACYDBW_08660, partial [Sulfuricaulis sp.]